MIRFVSILVVLYATAAHAQRNDIWNNPGLSQRGIQYGEQQIILRQDMAECHGKAFERAREAEDEHKRRALGVELFNRCMADKGWFARGPGPRKPPAKSPGQTAT